MFLVDIRKVYIKKQKKNVWHDKEGSDQNEKGNASRGRIANIFKIRTEIEQVQKQI